MYKGYKLIEDERFYTIYDEQGKVCGKGTISYLKSNGKKTIIDELIKHRIPQKPNKRLETEVTENRLNVKVLCFCPYCGWELGEIDDEWKYHHCANCGQVIDWGEL
ncbi:MAG: hypothetical protein K5768_10630 [Firmicutes bacterium]|nr:hypothetical protein [Bacillota bacterium]